MKLMTQAWISWCLAKWNKGKVMMKHWVISSRGKHWDVAMFWGLEILGIHEWLNAAIESFLSDNFAPVIEIMRMSRLNFIISVISLIRSGFLAEGATLSISSLFIDFSCLKYLNWNFLFKTEQGTCGPFWKDFFFETWLTCVIKIRISFQ